MKNYFKKALAAVVIFSFCSFSAVAYAEPADIQNHWARNEISRWIDAGVLKGDAHGRFNPDASITRAEFAAIINRVFKYQDKAGIAFSDVKSTDWFAEDIDLASTAGILLGSNGKARPNEPVSRQEAAVIFARAFGLETKDSGAVNGFKDAASVASWSRSALSALYEKGYISGRPGDIIAPTAFASRAETAKMLGNIVAALKNTPSEYSGTIDGNLVVNAAGTTLRSMEIKGDLYLTQGIGNGDVTLESVVVHGRTIISGGGEHSIVVKNSTLNGKLIIYKSDGKIRVIAEGSTTIASVVMQSGGTLEEKELSAKGFENVEIVAYILQGQSIQLEGDFSEVAVEAPGTVLYITDGSVISMVMAQSALGSEISLSESATIDTVKMDSAVSIKGNGKIINAFFNSDGITMEQLPEVIEVSDGITIPANLKKDTAAGAGGGGGGGGGLQPEVLNVNSASARIGGKWIEATEVSDGVWEVDISGEDSTAMFTDIRVNAGDDVKYGKVGFLIFSRSISFIDGTGQASVKELLGALDTGEPGVSVKSIEGLGVSRFHVIISDENGNSETIYISLIM